MSSFATGLIAVGAFVSGVIIGGVATAWHGGLLTSSESATAVAQVQIDQAVEDSRQLGEARATADRSAQDAQVQIRTVREVVRECPPGAGVLSPGLSGELRDLFSDPASAESGGG